MIRGQKIIFFNENFRRETVVDGPVGVETRTEDDPGAGKLRRLQNSR